MLSLCSYQNRLLHPGASTADILSQYISTMKSLHVVDPSGAAAERVCQPVQAYLRCGVLLGATLAGSGGTPCPVMQHCNCLSPQPTPTPLVIQNQRRHCAMHCGQPHWWFRKWLGWCGCALNVVATALWKWSKSLCAPLELHIGLSPTCGRSCLLVLLLPLSWETKKRMIKTLVSGCQNLLVSNQVSQLRVLGVYIRSCVCCVQPSYTTVSCVGGPLQERGHKDQNLLTLLGKCQ